MRKINRTEIDPKLLAELEAEISQNVISNEVAITSLTRSIVIPLDGFVTNFHKFIIFKNGILYNQNNYTIVNNIVTIRDTEPELVPGDKIEFVFIYNQNKLDLEVVPDEDVSIHGQDIIDETVDIDKLDKVTSARIESISNPNMLYNGDFSIWQRGESIIGNARNYGADRWALWTTGSPVFSKTDNGAHLLCTGNDNIIQALDGYQGKHFDALTLSAKIKSNVYGCTFKIFIADNERIMSGDSLIEYEFINETPDVYHTISVTIKDVTIQNYLMARCYFIGSIYNDAEVEIEYIKLEEGEVATPHIRTNPLDELQRCKAFYETGEAVLYYSGSDNLWTVTDGDFSVEKRKIPTIKTYSLVDGTEKLCSNILGTENTTETIDSINPTPRKISTLTVSPSVNRAVMTFKWTADAEIY